MSLEICRISLRDSMHDLNEERIQVLHALL